MSQLPLEFKLLYQSRFVGIEIHEKDDLGIYFIYWYDSKGIKSDLDEIIADEKRQWIGYKDRNGKKIYFGDKIKHPEDNLVCTIELSHGEILAIHPDMSPGFQPILFKYMEIVDE